MLRCTIYFDYFPAICIGEQVSISTPAVSPPDRCIIHEGPERPKAALSPVDIKFCFYESISSLILIS